MSFVHLANLPSSSLHTVTVSGLNFVAVDLTPSARPHFQTRCSGARSVQSFPDGRGREWIRALLRGGVSACESEKGLLGRGDVSPIDSAAGHASPGLGHWTRRASQTLVRSAMA